MSVNKSLLQKRLRPLGYDLKYIDGVLGIASITEKNNLFIPYEKIKTINLTQILMMVKQVESQLGTISKEGRELRYLDSTKLPETLNEMKLSLGSMSDDFIYILSYERQSKNFIFKRKRLKVENMQTEVQIIRYMVENFFQSLASNDVAVYFKKGSVLYINCATNTTDFDNTRQSEMLRTFIEPFYSHPELEIKEVKYIAAVPELDNEAQGAAYTTFGIDTFLPYYICCNKDTLIQSFLDSVKINREVNTIHYGYLDGRKEFMQSSVKVEVAKEDKAAKQIKALTNRQKYFIYSHYAEGNTLNIFYQGWYKSYPTVVEREIFEKLKQRVLAETKYTKVNIQLFVEDALITIEENNKESNTSSFY